MSIIISGLKLDINEDDSKIFEILQKKYKFASPKFKIYKKSIDARRLQIKKVLSVLVETQDEQKFIKKYDSPQIKLKQTFEKYVPKGKNKLETRPIIIGFGPAGIFAAYELAKYGYKPQVFEMGEEIDKRDILVDNFIKNKVFNKNSNIQFGEGGAGAYSDGKLTTRINDNRCEYILETLYKFGAPEDILYKSKPHIGTDILKQVIKNIRQDIINKGGSVKFNAKLTDIVIKNDKIHSVFINNAEIPAQNIIFAVGHSARDTFELIHNKNIFIEPKAFAIGARIEHLQEDINKALYKNEYKNKNLPVSEYNLANTINDRGCYSFCMCPGGVVVPSNSEEETVVTNGMSYHDRGLKNANSAIVVSVKTSDFAKSTPLAGMYFQREIEKNAYVEAGSNYNAPCQLLGDFLEDRNSKQFKSIEPSYQIGTSFVKMSDVLPEFVVKSIKENMPIFMKKNSAFKNLDAVFTGVETRTSSPIRITRNDEFESLNVCGFYPCGEGAGYAGGIMSSAIDGVKIAQKIMDKYRS